MREKKRGIKSGRPQERKRKSVNFLSSFTKQRLDQTYITIFRSKEERRRKTLKYFRERERKRKKRERERREGERVILSGRKLNSELKNKV